MKRFRRFLIMIGIWCLSLPLMAQNNAVFVGAVAATDAANNQQAQVSGAFRKYLFGAQPDQIGSVSSMTFYDVSGISFKPFSVSHAQYQTSQAISVKLYQPVPWFSLNALGDAGLVGTAGVATGSQFGGGGYGEFYFRRNVRALVMPKVTKNTLTGTAFQLRGYLGVAW